MGHDHRAPVILLTTLLLASCAQVQLPPAELLANCDEPKAAIQTNGLLANYALALRTSLRSCNDDKAALREWASQLGKP